MVVHQTPAKAPGLCFDAHVSKHRQIEPTVCVTEEDGLALISALRDVVGDARDNNARGPWHSDLQTGDCPFRDCIPTPAVMYKYDLFIDCQEGQSLKGQSLVKSPCGHQRRYDPAPGLRLV